MPAAESALATTFVAVCDTGALVAKALVVVVAVVVIVVVIHIDDAT